MTRRRPPSGPLSDPGDDRDEEPEEERMWGLTPDCNDYRCSTHGECVYERDECAEYLKALADSSAASQRFWRLMEEHLSKFSDEEIGEMTRRATEVLRQRGYQAPLDDGSDQTAANR